MHRVEYSLVKWYLFCCRFVFFYLYKEKESPISNLVRLVKTRNKIWVETDTYKSVLVLDVVGEFELMKRDYLRHPLLACRRRVRMDVHALWHFGVRFARHCPPRVVKLVTTVVGGHDVH